MDKYNTSKPKHILIMGFISIKANEMPIDERKDDSLP